MAFTYSKLAEVSVGATAVSTIDFNNIPQNYTDLILKVSARGSVVRGSGGYYYQVTVNGLTTNQTTRYINSNGTSATSGNFARLFGYMNDSGTTASTFGSDDWYFPNYSGNSFKSVSLDSINENNGTLSDMNILAGLWSNSAAINQLIITPNGGNFVQYSTATLYGVKAEV
jgi:hypothetical protein